MDWTKTVIMSLIKYDGANCNNKQFSFKERMTEKDEEFSDRQVFYTCFIVCFVFAFLILQLNEKHCLHDLKDIYISFSHIFRMSS